MKGTLHLRFDKRRAVVWTAGVLVLYGAARVASENVTLTTSYPSPAGIYRTITTTGQTVLARDGGRVEVGPQATANEGGEVRLRGASGQRYNYIDNYQGHYRTVIQTPSGEIGAMSIHNPTGNLWTYGTVDAPNFYIRSMGKWVSQLEGAPSAAGSVHVNHLTAHHPNCVNGNMFTGFCVAACHRHCHGDAPGGPFAGGMMVEGDMSTGWTACLCVR